MSENNSTYQQIEKYLNGGMSVLEVKTFEDELSQNPILQRQLEAFRLTDLVVFENRLLDIKDLVQQTHGETKKKNSWRKYLFLACVVVLGGLSALWYSLPSAKEKSSFQKQVAKEEAIKVEKQIALPIIEKKQTVVSSKAEKYVVDNQETTMSNQIMENTDTVQEQEMLLVPKKKGGDSSMAIYPLEVKEVSPCRQIKIEADVFTTSTCEGESEGQISISGYKGGKAPYSVTILSSVRESVVLPYRLGAGKYEAKIVDANHCSTLISGIEIKEKRCNKHDHFNPFIGETWPIPVHTTEGELVILDKTGNVYFSIVLPSGVQEQWSGQSLDGELKTGYFVYHLKYQDGTFKQGTVTIVR